MIDTPRSTAKMRDGTELSYRLIAGEGEGRCVLVHSLAMDGDFWSRVAPLLRDHAQILTYDCRGHGLSGKPRHDYTIDLFADDLADLLDAVGWESAVVCGASMGGCVTIAFAAAYPKRVEGLGLFDTTEWYGEGAPKAWAERADKATEGGMAALVDFQKTRWFSDAFRAANPEIVDAGVAVFLANDVDAYSRTCRMLGAVDKRAALSGFAFPVEILVGSQDYATPVELAERLRSNIPGARMQVIDGARHFTPLEIPEVIAATIVTLLGRVRAA